METIAFVALKERQVQLSLFQNVDAGDSGEYKCVAGNVLGETSASLQLEISAAQTNFLHKTLFSTILFNMIFYDLFVR